MKTFNKKKGFTIVELVIVVAVIGVLTAILVPTFVNLSNKASEASNQSFVKNLNTQMAIRETEEGKNKTMHEAILDARDIGFDVEKLTPVNGRDLVWDSVADRFLLLESDGNVWYGKEEKKATKDIELWKVYDSMPAQQKYSIYAKSGWETNAIGDNEHPLVVGFDVGSNAGIQTIYYGNATGTQASIRTNGNMCTLTVNAPNDHVEHYGYAKEINVQAVNNTNSYHEYGTVGELKVTAGKVFIESTGVVFDLSATEGATATVENKGGNVMESSVDSVPASDSFEINSLAQLESFRDSTNSGYTFEDKIINLNVDVTLRGAWTPISNYYRKTNQDKWFAGTFNGNNHTVKGLTNAGILVNDINTGYNSTTPAGKTEYVYGFFASVNGATIKNLSFEDVKISELDPASGIIGDHVAAAVGYAEGGVTLSKISVKSGTITEFDDVAGLIGGIRTVGEGNTATVSECVNSATITANLRAAGICSDTQNKSAGKVVYNGCVNKGNIVSLSDDTSKITRIAAGIAICAINETPDDINFVGCEFDEGASLTSNGFSGKITVIYTTSYNYNSTGNILTENAGSNKTLDKHVSEQDSNGHLTVSKDSEHPFIANWN